MRIERAEIEHYGTYLKEKSRPPSRGGNSGAWHQHVITIAGAKYSFLAPWSGKLVYKGETVSFNWDWDLSGKFRNAELESVVAIKPNGEEIWRGNRHNKKWRTADTRPPGRRSEWEN